METKKVYLKQVKGLTLAAKGESNHWITMDGPEKLGGSNAGVRPKELVLIALAGCTGSDVVSILQKKMKKKSKNNFPTFNLLSKGLALKRHILSYTLKIFWLSNLARG